MFRSHKVDIFSTKALLGIFLVTQGTKYHCPLWHSRSLPLGPLHWAGQEVKRGYVKGNAAYFRGQVCKWHTSCRWYAGVTHYTSGKPPIQFPGILQPGSYTQTLLKIKSYKHAIKCFKLNEKQRQ